MASRTKVISRTLGAGGILSLILWFVLSNAFDTEIDLNDQVCAGDFLDPCEAQFNITSNQFTYYLYNKEGIDLNFIPNVKDSYICKRDGRLRASKRANREEYPCGIGWREFDFKTPLTSRYKYIEKFEKGKKKQYKLVVFKFNPEDEIKWGGKITGEEFDPKFLPVFPDNVITKCDTEKYVDIIFSDVTKQRTVTICSNTTGPNTDCNGISEQYSVREIVGKVVKTREVNCRTIGLRVGGSVLMCPDNYCCSVIDDEFCMMDRNDGDCNYNPKQNKGWGWTFVCPKISELTEGKIKISTYKEIYAEVKRI